MSTNIYKNQSKNIEQAYQPHSPLERFQGPQCTDRCHRTYSEAYTLALFLLYIQEVNFENIM